MLSSGDWWHNACLYCHCESSWAQRKDLGTWQSLDQIPNTVVVRPLKVAQSCHGMRLKPRTTLFDSLYPGGRELEWGGLRLSFGLWHLSLFSLCILTCHFYFLYLIFDFRLWLSLLPASWPLSPSYWLLFLTGARAKNLRTSRLPELTVNYMT